MPEKIVITNGTVFTIDAKFKVIENGSIVIEEGIILDIGKNDTIEKKYSGDMVIDANKKVIFPGLIDLHYHSQILHKGLYIPGIETLDDWLKDFMYPLLAYHLSPKDAYVSALLAYVQSIKSGVTCVNNMTRHLISCADAAKDVGIRTVLSSQMGDLFEGETPQDNEQAFREKHNSAKDKVKIWFGVEWMPMCTLEFLEKVRDLAREYNTGIHIHLNETKGEIENVKKKWKKRPIEVANELGILGPNCVGAHCVWLNDREVNLLRETGTHVSHNPVSNMWCAAGFATRIPDLVKAGVNVGLGTDSPIMGDMFESIKSASLVHKSVHLDRSVMPEAEVLKMATLNGAKALGLDKEIGSIELGKKADIIIVNMDTNVEPVHSDKSFNVLPNLLYNGNSRDVDTVIIDGKIVMRNRKLKTVNEREIIEKAKKAAENLMKKFFDCR